jgi:hypothetical protein
MASGCRARTRPLAYGGSGRCGRSSGGDRCTPTARSRRCGWCWGCDRWRPRGPNRDTLTTALLDAGPDLLGVAEATPMLSYIASREPPP